MNLIGSRCRRSTHENVNESCNWCLDAGPTFSLRYQGITTEYLANLQEKKVIHFIADAQGNTQVKYSDNSEIVMSRNGTVLYTFRSC
jgi:sulfite reductase alpha subunit-like flavoprotein